MTRANVCMKISEYPLGTAYGILVLGKCVNAQFHQNLPLVKQLTACGKLLSREMGFPSMWYMRPAKHQISLRICAV